MVHLRSPVIRLLNVHLSSPARIAILGMRGGAVR
jgi:hypothetical protein